MLVFNLPYARTSLILIRIIEAVYEAGLSWNDTCKVRSRSLAVLISLNAMSSARELGHLVPENSVIKGLWDSLALTFRYIGLTA